MRKVVYRYSFCYKLDYCKVLYMWYLLVIYMCCIRKLESLQATTLMKARWLQKFG